MENYNIRVEEAIHIPLISQKLAELTKITIEKRNILPSGFVLLNHQEGPAIIRGPQQDFEGTFDEALGYHLYNGIPEIRRRDGGWTWYHQNNVSKCLNQYGNISQGDRVNSNWKVLLRTILDLSLPGFNISEIKHNSPDLYQNDRKQKGQIMGTSASQYLRRGCFYEGDKRTVRGSLKPIVEADKLHVLDSNHFFDSFETFPKGSSETLIAKLKLGHEISSSDFIEGVNKELVYNMQLPKSGDFSNKRGSCIGKEYLNYVK